jgi:integrase
VHTRYRLASVDLLTVGDLDERRGRIRLGASTTKNAPLFPGATADRLRTAIARACKASEVPVFSPHALRHRRISLLHAQGRPWAEIGRFVGQKKLSLTADTYTHVLSDGAELDLSTASSGTRNRQQLLGDPAEVATPTSVTGSSSVVSRAPSLYTCATTKRGR